MPTAKTKRGHPHSFAKIYRSTPTRPAFPPRYSHSQRMAPPPHAPRRSRIVAARRDFCERSYHRALQKFPLKVGPPPSRANPDAVPQKPAAAPAPPPQLEQSTPGCANLASFRQNPKTRPPAGPQTTSRPALRYSRWVIDAKRRHRPISCPISRPISGSRPRQMPEEVHQSVPARYGIG